MENGKIFVQNETMRNKMSKNKEQVSHKIMQKKKIKRTKRVRSRGQAGG